MYLIVPMAILLIGSATVLFGVLKFDELSRWISSGQTESSIHSVTLEAPAHVENTIKEKLRKEIPRLKRKCSEVDLGIYLGESNLDLFYRHLKQEYASALLDHLKQKERLPEGPQLTSLGNKIPGRVIEKALDSMSSLRQEQHDEILANAINQLEGDRLTRVHSFVTGGGPSLENLDHERGLEFLELVIHGMRRLDRDQLDTLHALWKRSLKELKQFRVPANPVLPHSKTQKVSRINVPGRGSSKSIVGHPWSA